MIAGFLSQLWVQRLGWTLLHFLWQGTAIAVVYALLRSVLGRALSAQGRYALACGALGAMVAAPPLTFLLIPNGHAAGLWTIAAAEWQRLLPAVVALWLLGVLAFSIRLLGGWRFTARLRSTAHAAPAEWRRTLSRIATRVGVRQSVRLLVSSLVDVPAVIGWLRPAILVPVEFFTGLPVEHITALLAHEMAHIRRQDYLASIVQGIAEAVLFYHPAVWWISEQIRAERELCCDDLAIDATGDVLAYARALAELESRQPSRIQAVLAANGGSLLNRIRRLMEPAHAVANNAPGPAAAWAMTLLWIAGVGVAAVHGAKAPVVRVVNRVSVSTPSPVVALEGKARNTLLYDPLLSSPPALPVAPTEEPVPEIAKIELMPQVKLPEPEPVVSAKSGENEIPSQVPMQITAPVPPAPVFRSATKLVQVDVVARSRDIPATGLTSGDFTVLDNGTPQKISLFSVNSSQATGRPSVPLPEGIVSNRLGRDEALANATVLLIDQKNTDQIDQAFAIQRIAKFLQARRKGDGKPERIGIYAFGRDGALHVVQEITGDAEMISRAATRLKSGDPSFRDYDTTGMSQHAAEEHRLLEMSDLRVMDTKQVLEAIARHLARVPGRKSLVWVTAGFPLVPRPGEAHDFDANSLMDATARVLNNAGVALYAVDARGLFGALSGTTGIGNAEWAGPQTPQQLRLPMPMPVTGSFLSGTDTMARLAGLTGGLALFNSNGIEDSIQRALDDGELTYTLGFYPAPQEQDGVWHKLKVSVAKRGVSVRYRERYFASRPLADANNRPPLSELLKGPLDATQLELVTETLPDRARPGCWQVRASVDLRDVHLENQNDTWSGAVDVSFFIEGSKTARTITRKVEIPDAQLAAALEKGIAVNDSIVVNNPAVGLRIVAQDPATGFAGSVRVPLIQR